MIHCVTTMNKEYYNGIGKIMIHTWLECFSNDYKLHLYLEDFIIEETDSRIIVENWKDVDDLYKIWEETRFDDNRKHQGFTKKALTQIAAFKKLQGEKIFWLDADVISIKPIPENFFDRIIEDYPLAVWDWSIKGFESGTVFVNSFHPDWQSINSLYEALYIGDKTSADNTRWFDGEVLEIAVKESGVRYNNLMRYVTKKSSVPINRSWIGDYIRHYMSHNKRRLEQDLIEEYGRPDLVSLIKGKL